MHTISVAEAYESGFTIADLDELILKRFEELYEDSEPAETIRRIAISQDAWSFEQTRRWLKSQLLARKPWRKHLPDLDAIIDSTLLTFYAGEHMSHITSMAQARLLSEADAAKQTRMAALAEEIYQELIGTTYAELPAFLIDVIAPKYSDGWPAADFEAVLVEAVMRYAQAPDFQQSLTGGVRWPKYFEVRDALTQMFGEMAAPRHQPIPDVTGQLETRSIPVAPPSETLISHEELQTATESAQREYREQKESQREPQFKEESVTKYPWHAEHEKFFETPGGLKVALVKITERKELLLEIGRKTDTQCQRFVLQGTKFIGVGDREQMLELLKTEQNVKMMVQFINEQFIGKAL